MADIPRQVVAARAPLDGGLAHAALVGVAFDRVLRSVAYRSHHLEGLDRATCGAQLVDRIEHLHAVEAVLAPRNLGMVGRFLPILDMAPRLVRLVQVAEPEDPEPVIVTGSRGAMVFGHGCDPPADGAGLPESWVSAPTARR